MGGLESHLTTKNPPSKPPKIAIPAKKIACQIARIKVYDDCKYNALEIHREQLIIIFHFFYYFLFVYYFLTVDSYFF